MNRKISVYPSPTPNEGEAILLSNPAGVGGEGAVYIAPRPKDGKEIAVKIFSDRKLESDREILPRKIDAMVLMGRTSGKKLVGHPMLAWPRLSVYNRDGRWIGYAMRRAKGKPLSRLAHPMLYRDHFPGMDREKVAKMLVQLLNGVQILHNHQVCIGDVNLNNFLWDGAGDPCFIDVDSFQIEGFPCPVGRPEMTPPEHLGGGSPIHFDKIVRTRESDFFSLGILVFQCLMLGRHPYEHIGGGSPVENLRKGHFPYASGGSAPGTKGGIPAGPWYKIWSHYTHNLKNAFVRAFKDGAADPSKRPSAEDWVRELKKYIGTLNRPGPAIGTDGVTKWRHSRDMIPAKPKPKPKLKNAGHPASTIHIQRRRKP